MPQPAVSAPPPSVFLSYSRADLAVVQALARALRAGGIATWLDVEDLRPGQRWKEAIAAALAACDAMLFCLSPPSLDSPWTRVEFDKARALGRRIIPVAVQSIEWHRLPPELAALQGHDMGADPPALAPARAARAVARALGLAASSGTGRGAAGDFGIGGVGGDGGDGGTGDDGADAGGAVAEVPWLLLRLDAGSADPWPAGLSLPPAAPVLDWREPRLLRLDDLAPWAAQARRVALLTGAHTDAGLLGLVLGALRGPFGVARVQVFGPAPDGLLRAAGW